MKQWITSLKNEANLLGKEKILIIPRRQMKHSFERVTLQEVPKLIQVEFMTLYEWMMAVTAGYRYRQGLREITHIEQVQFILHALEDVDASILTNEQKNLATAEAILQDMTLIRLNNLKMTVVNEAMQETMTLIKDKYEAYLREENLFDYARLLTLVDDDARMQVQVERAVKKSQISIYPNEDLSRKELELVERFRWRKLQAWQEEVKKNKVTSYETYGFANGVSDFLRKVIEEKIPFDEVCLVYTDSSQLSTIQREIEKMNLPATYAEGMPIASTETFNFFANLIEYILSDRPLLLWKKLIDENQIVVQIGEDEEKRTMDSRQLKFLFHRLLSIDGMTFAKRFKPLTENAIQDAKDKEKPAYLINHEVEIRRLIEVIVQLEEDIEQLLASNLAEAIDKLFKISNRLYRRSSKEVNIEYKALKRAFESFSHYTVEESSANDLRTVLEMVSSQNIHQSLENPGHLHVTSLHNLQIIYRSHYAWFGLATDEFKVKSNLRSPFISEERLNEENLLTDLSLFKILEARMEKLVKESRANHHLYFNCFNTKDIRDKNPIALWMEFVEEQAEKAHLIGYPIKDLQEENLSEFNVELVENPLDGDLKLPDDYRFSPSSAISLKECTRKFMYEKMMKISLSDYDELEHQYWIPNNVLGNLYHDLLERYEKEVMKHGVIDQDALLEEIFDKYANLYPALYEQQIIDEKEKAKAILKRHISVREVGLPGVHVEENFTAHIQFNEDEFEADESLEGITSQEFVFSGIIDRVDMDENQKHYMITDYKTNRSASADILQLLIYKKMLEKQEVKPETVTAQFDYLFQDKITGLRQKLSKSDQRNVTDFLKEFLTFNEQWDDVEFKESTGPCSYCEFKSLCRIREGEKDEGVTNDIG